MAAGLEVVSEVLWGLGTGTGMFIIDDDPEIVDHRIDRG